MRDSDGRTGPARARGAELSRRQALISALGALAAGASGLAALAGGAHAALPLVSREALEAFLDTLLPADALTPAPSALGCVDEIMDMARADPGFAAQLVLGSVVLDAAAGRPFAELSGDARREVADALAAQDPQSAIGRFYRAFRARAMEVYFVRPEARAGLDVMVTPQPEGYPPSIDGSAGDGAGDGRAGRW